MFGRDDCVQQLIVRIDDDNCKPLAVIGPPSVGKSSVARAAFDSGQMRNKFAECRHWISFDGFQFNSVSEISTLVARSISGAQGILSSFSLKARTPDAHLDSIFRTLTLSKPCMIVLDDFDALWHHSDASVQEFSSRLLERICSISHVTVVITMQGWMKTRPVVLDSSSTFRIKPLSSSDGELLFYKVCHRYDHDLKQIFEKIGCFPPVLIHLATICKKQNINAYALLKPLDRDPSKLLLPGPVNELKTIHSITTFIHHFPLASKFLFSLSMLPMGMVLSNQERLGRALDVPHLNELVDALCSLSLADWAHPISSDNRFDRLNIPAHVRVQLLSGSDFLNSGDARECLFSFYFDPTMLDTYAFPRRPGAFNSREVMEYTRLEQGNVESVLQTQLFEGCAHSVDAVKASIYYYKPLWALRPNFDIMTKAVAIAETKRQEDPLLYARALQGLGETEEARGYLSPAQEYLNKALHVFREHENILGQATCLHSLAVIKHSCSPQSPLEHFEEAYEKFGMSDDRHGQADFLLSWSEHLKKLDPTSSATRLKEASAIIDVLQNTDLCARRDLVAASTYHQIEQLCIIFTDTGNLVELANCQSMLGREGELKALEIYELLGRDLSAACKMRDLADSRSVPDKEAVRLYDKAIPIFDAARFTFHFAESSLELGRRLAHLGKLHDAAGIFRATIPRLHYSTNFTRQCALELVRCHVNLGQSEAAVSAAQDLLKFDVKSKMKCLSSNLRKGLQELESSLCSRMDGIADEQGRDKLLQLISPDQDVLAYLRKQLVGVPNDEEPEIDDPELDDSELDDLDIDDPELDDSELDDLDIDDPELDDPERAIALEEINERIRSMDEENTTPEKILEMIRRILEEDLSDKDGIADEEVGESSTE